MFWVNDLSRRYLKDPLVIDLVGDSDQKLADSISLYSVPSNASSKQTMLQTLISKYGQSEKSIIFTKTKKMQKCFREAWAQYLEAELYTGTCNSCKGTALLLRFVMDVLMSWLLLMWQLVDLIFQMFDLVVHFEMPNSSEIFVHRSGRTGRAGKRGTAVPMFTESQRRTVRSIERDLGCKLKELPRITGGVGSKIRTMDVEGSDTEIDDVDHFAAGNNWPPQAKKYGNAREARGGPYSSFNLKGRGTLTGRVPFHGYERESGSDHFSKSRFKPVINTVGRNSRVGFSEYGLQSQFINSDTIVDDDNTLRRKRKPINSESRHHDLKQIPDGLW